MNTYAAEMIAQDKINEARIEGEVNRSRTKNKREPKDDRGRLMLMSTGLILALVLTFMLAF
jgi:hypothetical protein